MYSKVLYNAYHRIHLKLVDGIVALGGGEGAAEKCNWMFQSRITERLLEHSADVHQACICLEISRSLNLGVERPVATVASV